MTASQIASSRASASTLASMVSLEAASSFISAARIPQGCVEAAVADVDEGGMLGMGTRLILASVTNARLPSAPHSTELRLKLAAAVAQVDQVVAGDAAVELGKALFDQRRVIDADAVEQAMDRADAVAPGA